MQINENIKQARVSKKLSQQKVADLLGEKRSTYAEWERETPPRADVLAKISSVLEMPIERLLGKEKGYSSQEMPVETNLDLFLKIMLTNFADLKNGQVDIMNQHKFGRAELRAFVMMSSMKDARNDPKRLEGIMETYDKLLSETLTANERTDKDHIDGR